MNKAELCVVLLVTSTRTDVLDDPLDWLCHKFSLFPGQYNGLTMARVSPFLNLIIVDWITPAWWAIYDLVKGMWEMLWRVGYWIRERDLWDGVANGDTTYCLYGICKYCFFLYCVEFLWFVVWFIWPSLVSGSVRCESIACRGNVFDCVCPF